MVTAQPSRGPNFLRISWRLSHEMADGCALAAFVVKTVLLVYSLRRGETRVRENLR